MECPSQVTYCTTLNAAIADVELTEIAISEKMGCGMYIMILDTAPLLEVQGMDYNCW